FLRLDRLLHGDPPVEGGRRLHHPGRRAAEQRLFLGELRVPGQVQGARDAHPPWEPEEAHRADQEGLIAKRRASVTEKQAASSDTKLRLPAEEKYEEELAYLAEKDKGSAKPFAWRLSPRMLRTFVLGSTASDKLDRQIPQKFFGDPSLVERAIVTLASD